MIVLPGIACNSWYCSGSIRRYRLVQIVCILLDQPGLAQGDEEDEVVVMAEVDLLNESAIETKKQLVVADTK